jgi:prepilin signal peptidase PulO-like enzyme (type II secretory pathway)
MPNQIQHFLVVSMPQMPPEAWWVAAIALVVLGTAAAIDLFKGIVPDPLIFFGMIGIVAAKGMYVEWPFAAHQMTWGILAAAIIWGINELWHRLFKHDALGLGDAKWSMLAVTCFGALPVLFAWGIGAILGSIWIVLQKIARRKNPYLHFAPFLFMGLIIGIWAVRLEGWQSLQSKFFLNL